MLKVTQVLFLSYALAAGVLVSAQQSQYGQCGGIGWTGSTTCVSPYVCTYGNDYYSQCLPGTATATTTTSKSSSSSSTSTTTTTSTAPSGSFTNPVIWADFADNDITEVDGVFYYMASNMHYSPGAPILKSYDLVHWEMIGHAVPQLSYFGIKYTLTDGLNGYVRGTWASAMRYRYSNKTWYWYGCVDFSETYIFTALDPADTWTYAGSISTCFYDCGLLIDDDDSMYVAYGGGATKNVAKLASNGLSISTSTQVYSAPASVTTGSEGSRFYKSDGYYYIITDDPSDDYEFVLRSSTPQGTYSEAIFQAGVSSPVASSSAVHQGSLINVTSSEWYYMGFVDAYPLGRMPVLAPISFPSGGYPSLTSSVASSYAYPIAAVTLSNGTGTDTFSGTSLSPYWEWNHDPDTSKFSVSNGLTMYTATVTSDLYAARNTLTHRVYGPSGSGTFYIDFTNMADGDRVGLALFRQSSASIEIYRSGSTYTIRQITGMTQSETDWSTTSTGSVVATASISQMTVYLRATGNYAPSSSKTATFSYSLDGSSYTTLGSTFTLNTDWEYFMGYRYALYNFATSALGGYVKVNSFTI